MTCKVDCDTLKMCYELLTSLGFMSLSDLQADGIPYSVYTHVIFPLPNDN